MKPRAIWVSPYVPWPLRSGGRLRTAHLAKELAESFRVAIVATVSSDDKGADLGAAREALGAFADPIVLVPRAIVAAHSYTFSACAGAGAPVVIDEHNRESDLLATLEPGPVRAAITRASYRAYERRALRASRGVLACHEAEADAARAAGARSVHVVPNGVDAAAFPFALPSSRPRDRVLFTGTFAHRPNADAARWLALEVWPRVVAARPSARLALVGHAPPADVAALAGASIEVVGSAPSMAPHFAGASVYAAAVRAGAGTNLKTLEAASAGLALVATAKALDGHPLAAPRDCLAADEPAGFAAALVRALDDPAACDERASSARAIVEARCTWSRVGEAMRAAFEEMFGP